MDAQAAMHGHGALIDEPVLRTLVEAATAAPSIYNSQPWRFLVGPRRIELYADPRRQLPIADASGRSLLISCGAALFNLRVAAAHLGFHPRVRLLPSENPTHVATVEVDHRHFRPGLLDELYPAIWARHTNRHPFWSRRPPASVLGRLVEAVACENAVVRIYDDPDEVVRIVDLLHDAEFEERNNPMGVAERTSWLAAEPSHDGVPMESLGPVPEQTLAAFRDLANGARFTRPTAAFETTPTVATLSTMHDGPVDWVRAGQALERLLLVATNQGLTASFMNQPLEQPDLRWLTRSPTTGLGYTQMLMRLGYGFPVTPTPRRPIADVIAHLGNGHAIP
jgi:nitroreductase